MSEITVAITPNPDARIFIANRTLIGTNAYLETTSDDAGREGLPALCQEVLKLPYVKRLFIMNNFVTIVKAAAVRWDDVLSELQQTIKGHLAGFEYSAAEGSASGGIES